MTNLKRNQPIVYKSTLHLFEVKIGLLFLSDWDYSGVNNYYIIPFL